MPNVTVIVTPCRPREPAVPAFTPAMQPSQEKNYRVLHPNPNPSYRCTACFEFCRSTCRVTGWWTVLRITLKQFAEPIPASKPLTSRWMAPDRCRCPGDLPKSNSWDILGNTCSRCSPSPNEGLHKRLPLVSCLHFSPSNLQRIRRWVLEAFSLRGELRSATVGNRCAACCCSEEPGEGAEPCLLHSVNYTY